MFQFWNNFWVHNMFDLAHQINPVFMLGWQTTDFFLRNFYIHQKILIGTEMKATLCEKEKKTTKGELKPK